MSEPTPRYFAFACQYENKSGNVTDRWAVADRYASDYPEWMYEVEHQAETAKPYLNAKMTGGWFVSMKRNKMDAKLDAREKTLADWKERGIDPENDESRAQKVRKEQAHQPEVWGTWS